MPSLMDSPIRVEWYTNKFYGDTLTPHYWHSDRCDEEDMILRTGRIIAMTDKCVLVAEDGTDRLTQAEAWCFHMLPAVG